MLCTRRARERGGTDFVSSEFLCMISLFCERCLRLTGGTREGQPSFNTVSREAD